MEKRKMRIVVMVMTIALLGLLVVQLFWISNAIQMKEQLFSQNVNNALHSVVHKLEKQEALYALSNQVHENIFAFNNDNPNVKWFGREAMEAFEKQIHAPAFKRRMGEIEIIIDGDNIIACATDTDCSIALGGHSLHRDVKVIVKRRLNFASKDTHQELRETIISIDSIMPVISRSALINESRYKALKSVFADVMNISKPLYERINFQKLENAVMVELHENDIDLPFELAIVQGKKQPVVIKDNGDFHRTLLASAYTASLFPSNVMEVGNQYLAVSFENPTLFILKSMWFILLIAALLIMAIASGFSYTLSSMLKQKRLADMKADFVNNMTHELKTPLASIALAAEALKDESIIKEPTQSARFLDIINEESQKLENHVEHVLNIAQLNRNDLKLNIVKTNVHALIENALSDYSIQIEKRQGELKGVLLATQFEIDADKEILKKIITNLFDNANKYSTQQPLITVKTENVGENISISVADRGIGISKSDQAKIFDKFYRVTSGNIHDVKGFGLGLSFVKGAIEAHGGSIKVESTPGKGSKFTITLPINIQSA